MDSNTKTVRTSLFARRVLPVLGIVTLTVALGACQTPPQTAAVPKPAAHEIQAAQDAATLQARSYELVQQSIRDARVKAAQDAATLQARSYELVQQSIRDARVKAAQDAATLQARSYELVQQSIRDAMQ